MSQPVRSAARLALVVALTTRVVYGRFASSTAFAAVSSKANANDEHPSCNCDCCAVVERRPNEIVAGAGVKCAPSTVKSADTCGEQCGLPNGDKVLAASVVDEALDYQRFCFFECKPPEGASSPVKAQCLALEPEEVKRVVDANGDAMDPAIVYGPPPAEASQKPIQGQTVREVVAKTYGSQPATYAAPPVTYAYQTATYGYQPAAYGEQPASTYYGLRRSASLLGGARRLRRRAVLAVGVSVAAPAPAAASPAAAPADNSTAVANEAAAKEALDGKHLAEAQTAGAIAETVKTKQYERDVAGGFLALRAPYSSIDDIRQTAIQTGEVGDRATRAARLATEALRNARRSNLRIATNTAQNTVQEWRAFAANQMFREKELMNMSDADRAILQARQPWIDAANGARQVADQFRMRATEAEKELNGMKDGPAKQKKLAEIADLKKKAHDAVAMIGKYEESGRQAAAEAAFAHGVLLVPVEPAAPGGPEPPPGLQPGPPAGLVPPR